MTKEITDIESKVYKFLIDMGANPAHHGYTYLKLILVDRLTNPSAYSSQNMMSDYDRISVLSKEQYGIKKTYTQIERCIRFEVSTILKCNKPESIAIKNKIFGENVTSMKNGHFIAGVQEYLKFNI